MINRYILVFLTLFSPFCGFSQKNKGLQVLVYGYGADAYAAALQSSMSNLNTVWLVNGESMLPELTSEYVSVGSAAGLDAGIWADLLARTLRGTKPDDSLSAVAKRRINPRIVQNIMDSVLTSRRNLTVVTSAQVQSVKKSGKAWQVELADKRRYKVHALVDASVDGFLARLAVGHADSVRVRTALPDEYIREAPYTGLARTGVAVGASGHRGYTLPLATVVPAGDGNLFYTRRWPAVTDQISGTVDDVPLLMHIGQAVGAAAAYTAFYRTTPDKLDARSIQGELLQYGARLVPFVDVPINSPHFAAIQRVGATGVLIGRSDADGRLAFDPESFVTAEEIKPVLNQLFSRSQIWFVNHPSVDTLTLADLLSYIKFVGQRGEELEGQLQKYWKRRFQLDDPYEVQQPVNRRVFAVLMDIYCRPFDVKVGMDGIIQR